MSRSGWRGCLHPSMQPLPATLREFISQRAGRAWGKRHQPSSSRAVRRAGDVSAAEPSGGRGTCQQPSGWRKFNGAGESANKCKGLAKAGGGNRAKAGRNARACTFAEGGRDETSLPNDRKPRQNTPITIDGSGGGRICCRPELARVGSKRPQPTDGNVLPLP